VNTDWVLFHLHEAQEELARTINLLESTSEADEIEFEIGMAHLYHHLNTAWNSRQVGPEQTANHSSDEFYAWRKFPTDLPLE
jgi:hypothetical protein